MKQYKLPQRPNELEWVAKNVFVPRIEAILEALVDERGTLTVSRGSVKDTNGAVFIDAVFGRKDARAGHWTAFLVRVELDPQNNTVCIQAGEHSEMNRQLVFAEKGWNTKLVEGFEWVLSDSMRRQLQIQG